VALTQVAIQQALASIEEAIRELQMVVEEVRQGQLSDRRGLLRAGIDQFEQARALHGDAQTTELRQAIQTLNEARRQLLESAETSIRTAVGVPQTGLGFQIRCFFGKGGATIDRVEGLLDQAKEEVGCALEATRYLVAARQVLGETPAAEIAVRQLREWWQENSPRAQRACRLLPADGSEQLPELTWRPQLIDRLAESLAALEATQTSGCEIVIEVTKDEIDAGTAERHLLP